MKKIFLFATVILVSGCANLNSVYRQFDIADGKGAMVDIKQRAIIVTNDDTFGPVVCAEPSPDALSAYAAELAGEANVPGEIQASLAAAFQESSSFVGLRTQSIQLLRDSLYRLCEGYMSGALDRPQYDILMRRYQKYMVALLGIEQLTGAVRAPTVTINTEGSAEAARAVSELRSEQKKIDESIKQLEEEKGKKETTEDRKKAIDSELADLKGDKAAIAKGIESARGFSASGKAVSLVSNVGVPGQRSDEHLQAVTKAIEGIVTEVITSDDTVQLCFSYLSNPKAEDDTYSPLKDICENRINTANQAIALKVQAESELLKSLMNSKSKTPESRQDLLDLINRLERNAGGLRPMLYDR